MKFVIMQCPYSLILLYVTLPLLMNAQIDQNSATLNEGYSGLVANNTSIRVKSKKRVATYEEARLEYGKIKGSPYLYNNDRPLVNLIVNNGDTIFGKHMAYDLYQDEILVSDIRKVDELVIEKAFFRAIYSADEAIDFDLMKVHPEHPDKFYEVIYRDSLFTFFKDVEVEIMNHTRNVPGNVADEKKFFRRTIYYAMKNGKHPEPFNLRKDDILKFVPRQHKVALRSAIKAEGIKKLKKEDHYIELFNLVQEFLEES